MNKKVSIDHQHNDYLINAARTLELSPSAVLHFSVLFSLYCIKISREGKGRIVVQSTKDGVVSRRLVDVSPGFSSAPESFGGGLELTLHDATHAHLVELADTQEFSGNLQHALMRSIWLCYDVVSLGTEGRRFGVLGEGDQFLDQGYDDLREAILPEKVETVRARLDRLDASNFPHEKNYFNVLVLALGSGNFKPADVEALTRGLDMPDAGRRNEIDTAVQQLNIFTLRSDKLRSPGMHDSVKGRSSSA